MATTLEQGIRGLLLVALAYGIWKFDGSRLALQGVFDDYLPALKPLASKLSIDLQDTGPVHLIQQAFSARHSTLLLIAGGVLLYGILQLTEAVCLWLMKRWGEYVAAVATTIFIALGYRPNRRPSRHWRSMRTSSRATGFPTCPGCSPSSCAGVWCTSPWAACGKWSTPTSSMLGRCS